MNEKFSSDTKKTESNKQTKYSQKLQQSTVEIVVYYFISKSQKLPLLTIIYVLLYSYLYTCKPEEGEPEIRIKLLQHLK